MAPLTWRCRDRVLRCEERPLVMGIVNVTPDSFADGGRYFEPKRAVEHALRLAGEGADIIDIGGESTRPGAVEVNEDEEIRRVLPVIGGLACASGTVLSIDTRKAAVAKVALEAGAHIVNDVSALSHDQAMAAVVRDHGAGVVLMHMRGEPRTMQDDPRYADVAAEVQGYLAARIRAAEAAGIAAECIAIDPGIGFGKTCEHNLAVLAGLPALAGLGRPVVVGLSRKRFLGMITGREPEERLAATIAATVLCLQRGARIVRVHDVGAARDAILVMAAMRGAG